MAVQQTSFFCPVCQQQRLFTRQEGVNHILHLLVTLFSCGLWAFVWFMITISNNPRFHCSQCGHSDAYKYLANPNLRSQEAQQNAERAALQSSSPSAWFSGFSSQSKILAVVGVLLFIGIGTFIVVNLKRQPNTQSNANSTSNNSSVTTTPSPKIWTLPSSLSPAENLEVGKKELSEGSLSIAAIHLAAIPKNAKEYASARQLLAQIASRSQRKETESRKEIEEQLANLASEDEQLDRALDMYDGYDGPAATATKSKALKRKAQIQLRRTELERKLKTMP